MSRTRNAWPAGATATMNVTLTQGNAAGGAIVVEISPGTGNEFIVMGGRATNSGTNGMMVDLQTAVAGTPISRLGAVGSAATTQLWFPGGVASNTIAANANPAFPWIVSGTQALKIYQTGAGAQSDTFLVAINVRLRGGSLPTVTKANSTNPADVTVTAGALSFTVIP